MNTLESPRLTRTQNSSTGEGSCEMCALGRGEIGCVCALEADPSESRRLAELGLVHGALVRMIKPGRACIVGLNCTRLSLGATLQKHVKVTRIRVNRPEPMVA